MKTINPYPLRLEEETMEELKIMADAHLRSVNKEIEYIIIEALREFKKNNNSEKDKQSI